jgi:hypothetical protein
MREVEYRSSGVPLEEYELTRGDHRRQKQSDEISERVQRQVDEDNAKCRADPARAERRRQAFENVSKLMQSFKKQDHEIISGGSGCTAGTSSRVRRTTRTPTLSMLGNTASDALSAGKTV